VKLGLFRLRQRLRRDKIGFVWVCIGFVLGLFSASEQLDLFSYSFVNTLFTFIWSSGKLALFGFVLALFGFVFTQFAIGNIFIIPC